MSIIVNITSKKYKISLSHCENEECKSKQESSEKEEEHSSERAKQKKKRLTSLGAGPVVCVLTKADLGEEEISPSSLTFDFINVDPSLTLKFFPVEA